MYCRPGQDKGRLGKGTFGKHLLCCSVATPIGHLSLLPRLVLQSSRSCRRLRRGDSVRRAASFICVCYAPQAGDCWWTFCLIDRPHRLFLYSVFILRDEAWLCVCSHKNINANPLVFSIKDAEGVCAARSVYIQRLISLCEQSISASETMTGHLKSFRFLCLALDV